MDAMRETATDRTSNGRTEGSGCSHCGSADVRCEWPTKLRHGAGPRALQRAQGAPRASAPAGRRASAPAVREFVVRLPRRVARAPVPLGSYDAPPRVLGRVPELVGERNGGTERGKRISEGFCAFCTGHSVWKRSWVGQCGLGGLEKLENVVRESGEQRLRPSPSEKPVCSMTGNLWGGRVRQLRELRESVLGVRMGGLALFRKKYFPSLTTWFWCSLNSLNRFGSLPHHNSVWG